eukprot:SAG31_NODE_2164_length_6283_cov_2.762451_3_plen_52_part_00
MGKEEIMGLVAAVELFLATDERALYVEWYAEYLNAGRHHPLTSCSHECAFC